MAGAPRPRRCGGHRDANRIHSAPRRFKGPVRDTRSTKSYPRDLYDRQFSLYTDNILARNELQTAAYRKEEKIPPRLFEVLEEQRDGLVALKAKFGPIVTPDHLMEG
jgi:hypothetical protein